MRKSLLILLLLCVSLVFAGCGNNINLTVKNSTSKNLDVNVWGNTKGTFSVDILDIPERLFSGTLNKGQSTDEIELHDDSPVTIIWSSSYDYSDYDYSDYVNGSETKQLEGTFAVWRLFNSTEWIAEITASGITFIED